MADVLTPLRVPPGLYRNGTKYQAKGRWYDANLVRFFEGAILPVRGWRIATDTDSTALAALSGIPRNALAWRSAAGDALIAVGTTTHLYIIKNGTAYDITPVDFVAGGNDAANAGIGNYNHGKYGRGLYGRGALAIASPLTDPGTWQLDAFGDTLVACPPGGGIYIWTVETTPSTPAVRPTDAPDVNRAAFVTSERFLVALGASSVSVPDGDVRRVLWASQNTTDDWDITSTTNTAGDFYLPTNGRIMCGRRTKAQGLIWTDCDLYSMTYIGGDFIYSFKQEGDNCGIISPNAVAIVDTAAIWMGRDNFYGYDGFVKPLPCDVHDHVFGSFNEKQAGKVFACTVAEFGEIWWFYPSAGSVENDRYVVFNYRENHWTTGTLARTCAIDRGAVPDPVMFGSDGTVYVHEVSGGTRLVPLSVALKDTLVDSNTTLLQAHTPSGATGTFAWTKVQGSGLAFNASNGLQKDSTAEPYYVVSVDPGVDDYEVSVVAHVDSSGQSQDAFGGVGARMATDSPLGYHFGVNSLTPTFVLRGIAADGSTIFQSTAPVPSTLLNTDVTLTLAVSGTSIKGYANGVLVLQATNSVITSGRPGLVGGWKIVTGPGATTKTDTFTDSDATAMQSHTATPDGFAWTKINADDATIQSNKWSSGSNSRYRMNVDTGSDDQRVTLTGINFGGSGDRRAYAFARANTSNGSRYDVMVAISQSPTVQLYAIDAAGNQTTIGSYNATISAGTDYTLELNVQGSSITVKLDGVVIISVTDTTVTSGHYCGVASGNGNGSGTTVINTFEAAYGGTVNYDTALVYKGSFTLKVAPATTGGSSSDGAALAGFGEAVLVPFLESGPIEIGDGDRFMRIQRIIPDEKNRGDTQMTLWTAFFPTETETENGPYSMTNPTDVRLTARQVRVRHEQVNDTDWRIGITRLGLTPGERR